MSMNVILKRCLQVIVYTKPSSRWADSETIASANNAVGSRARENSVAGEIQQIDLCVFNAYGFSWWMGF